jgi:hypothetical protein
MSLVQRIASVRDGPRTRRSPAARDSWARESVGVENRGQWPLMQSLLRPLSLVIATAVATRIEFIIFGKGLENWHTRTTSLRATGQMLT